MDTLNPLTHYKGIIYIIQNTVNNKRYIGKTIYHFTRRYPSGKWWEYTNNPYLKRAAQKYGIDAFSITILEHSKTREELVQLEQKYAIEYNSYYPNGYNLVECGADPKQHPASVEKRSKTVILNNPEGKVS